MAAFSLNIEKRVLPSTVVSGKFDGSHACLAAVCSGGNIIVHNPHRQLRMRINDCNENDGSSRLSWDGELAELQIGSEVSAFCVGRVGEDERDVMLIGINKHILAYHVEDNVDIFYKEMADGVLHIAVGKLDWLRGHVIAIGGNSTVTILDAQGVEIFWTAMGDIVTSIVVFDFDGDGENELLIGTCDFEIRTLKEGSTMWDTKETAAVVALLGLPGRRFAYAVGNGTIGVYEAGQRVWRVKSKHKAMSLQSFDINGDGVLELITGWSSGKVDARSCSTGDVMFKVQLPSAVAGVVEVDYRRIGRADLVVVSVSGDVRGYAYGTTCAAASATTMESGEIVRELVAKKQALYMEIRQRAASVPKTYHSGKLAVSLTSTGNAAHLGIAAAPGLLVHCAIVFAEGVFEGETYVAHPNAPRGELEIALRPSKNVPVDIHVKICVGPIDANLLQVFEMTRQLPRFCMYEAITRSQAQQLLRHPLENGITLEVVERPQRIALWLNQNLLFNEEVGVAEESHNAASMEIWLRSLRDDNVHCFATNASGKIHVRTEDSTFAGDIVQSLSMYLGLRELSSEALFPRDERELVDALERIKGLREVDARLEAEIAGETTLLKSIILRLEDARILSKANQMKRRLGQLKNLNGDLMREHEIRRKSNSYLADSLKELNIGVQRVARLRGAGNFLFNNDDKSNAIRLLRMTIKGMDGCCH